MDTSVASTLASYVSPRAAVYFAVAFLGLVVGFFRVFQKKPEFSFSTWKNPNKNRKAGLWIPDTQFRSPIPQPYPHWDIDKTEPLPYRAFKHKYTINMGIRNMDWNSWIELDNQWNFYHEEKLKRIRERGTELYETSPLARPAAYELLQELKVYLSNRYPLMYEQTSIGLKNLATGESFDFRDLPLGEDPILIAAKLVQDDLAIMIESPNGEYFLRGGAIILAGFWRFRDKYNLPLSGIHTSGDVPKYKEKLQSGMEKFFMRLQPDKPVVRNNYFIQTDSELGWSSSIGKEEDPTVGWYTAREATDINRLYFRSERQSLRRLPKSGAVIFTVRTYFMPITKLCEEPYIPRRLLDGIQSWTGDVEEYKGYHKFKDVLEPYLEKVAQQQEKMGYSADKEPEVFPF